MIKPILFSLLILGPGFPAMAKDDRLTFRKATLDDLVDILNIRINAGSYKLPKPYGSIWIVVEGYIKEEKVFSAASGRVVPQKGEINFPAGTLCDFRVAMIDLDAIRLKEAKPGHCRLIVGWQTKGTGVGGSIAPTDVPKEQIDLSARFNMWMPTHDGRDLAPDKDGRVFLFGFQGIGDQEDVLVKCYFVGQND